MVVQFQKHLDKGCVDANECELGTHLCEQGGFPLTCINTPGGYECAVNPTDFADNDIKEHAFSKQSFIQDKL